MAKETVIIAPHPKNQLYINADTASVNPQMLGGSFTPVPSNNCFWGCLWFRTEVSISTSLPTILCSLANTSANNAESYDIRLFGVSPTTANIILSHGLYSSASGGTASTIYSLQTAPITLTSARWHKLQFFFNAAAANTQSIIAYDNVVQSLSVLAGTPAVAAPNLSYCRLMQYGLPSNFKMANIFLSCGTNTAAEVQTYKFGETSPLYYGTLGSLIAIKPPVVNVYGSKGKIKNAVNGQDFVDVGAKFTSLVHTTSNYVIL
jgi:hypothetical protein